MPTLYLHIGTPKTGTSALQNFCLRNRRALARKGYCFPRAFFYTPEAIRNSNGFFLLSARRNPDGSFADEQSARLWRYCMRKLASKLRRYPNVILSDEGIWNAKITEPGIWRDLKAESERQGFDIRIIVYLRRQDQFLSSLWAQKVKTAQNGDWGMRRWEDILPEADEKMRLNYHAALEEIARHFGRENLIVHIYDRDRFPNRDIVADFLNIIGLPMDAGFKPPRDRNFSLYGDTLEIKRIINTLPDITHDSLMYATRVARQCSAKEKVHPAMFSPEECREFLAKYEESNRLLARDYFGDADAKLFPDPDDSAPKWDSTRLEPYETLIRFFGTAVFAPPKQTVRQRLRAKVRHVRIALWKLGQRLSGGKAD